MGIVFSEFCNQASAPNALSLKPAMNPNQLLAMQAAIFIALLSLVVGVFLPILTLGALVNVPMDILYGLGFLPLMVTKGHDAGSLLASLGYMLWPPGLAVLIAWSANTCFRRHGAKAILASATILLPLLLMNTACLPYRADPTILWPSYTKSSTTIW